MQRWAGQVEFVGVGWSGSDDDYREFVARHGLTFPQIDDSSTQVFQRFGVPTQPAIALVIPDGEVQTIFGAADAELLDSILTDAVG
jgi:peroxiredoxin